MTAGAFSERMGLKAQRSRLQIEDIDQPLRNRLLNALLRQTVPADIGILDGFDWGHCGSERFFWQQIWDERLRFQLGSFPPSPAALRTWLTAYVSRSPWFEVYDLIESAWEGFLSARERSRFEKAVNKVLEQECSGYRLLRGKVGPLVSVHEIRAVESAIAAFRRSPSAVHLERAYELLADRRSPDFRNSIKESISAVEAVCGTIAGTPGGTLGKSLRSLKNASAVELHPALLAAFEKLYGYTSDAGGIRHALLEEEGLDRADATFMLVACSAFVTYLQSKTGAPTADT